MNFLESYTKVAQMMPNELAMKIEAMRERMDELDDIVRDAQHEMHKLEESCHELEEQCIHQDDDGDDSFFVIKSMTGHILKKCSICGFVV